MYQAGDVFRSCHCRHQMMRRRETDGGVSVAGGPGLSNADAPSISEVESGKDMLPPSYQDHVMISP